MQTGVEFRLGEKPFGRGIDLIRQIVDLFLKGLRRRRLQELQRQDVQLFSTDLLTQKEILQSEAFQFGYRRDDEIVNSGSLRF